MFFLRRPPVTVLLPVYNREHLVGRAIEGILRQTFSNFRLVVIDDGSTDGTATQVKAFRDRRLHLVSLPVNRGKAAAMNYGLAEAVGPFLLEHDSDDWLEPHALEALVAAGRQAGSDVAYLYGDRRVFDLSGGGPPRLRRLSRGEVVRDREDFTRRLKCFGPRFLRARAVREVGGWPTDYPSGGRLYEDYALITTLLGRYDCQYVPRLLDNIGRHADNITRLHRPEWWPIIKYLVARASRQWENGPLPVFDNARRQASFRREAAGNAPLVTVVASATPEAAASLALQTYPNLRLAQPGDPSPRDGYVLLLSGCTWLDPDCVEQLVRHRRHMGRSRVVLAPRVRLFLRSESGGLRLQADSACPGPLLLPAGLSEPSRVQEVRDACANRCLPV